MVGVLSRRRGSEDKVDEAIAAVKAHGEQLPGTDDAEAFVAHGFVSTPVICFNRCIISIGRGKTIVEFFSAAISVSV